MYAAHQQSILGGAVLLLIIASFLIIAALSWIRIRLTGEAAILLPRVVIVALILASVTGYLPRVVHIDEVLLMVLHIVLALLSWGYAIYSLIDLFDARRHGPAGERDAGTD